MYEQKGTFNGIDVFSIQNQSQFDFCYKLLDESESIPIKYRPDINSLLMQLRKENFISNVVVDAREISAVTYCEGISFKNIC